MPWIYNNYSEPLGSLVVLGSSFGGAKLLPLQPGVDNARPVQKQEQKGKKDEDPVTIVPRLAFTSSFPSPPHIPESRAWASLRRPSCRRELDMGTWELPELSRPRA